MLKLEESEGTDRTMSKHVHLIGICGTAMASVAGMLRSQGHEVTGSDTAAYPPMSDQLRALGIRDCRALCGRAIWTRDRIW